MRMSPQIFVATAMLFTLAGCTASQTQGEVQAPPVAEASSNPDTIYIRQVMQTRVNPAMLAIWDVGNNAMNEAGGIDPALMNEAKWTALAEGATRLDAASRDMAAAKTLRAAHPDNSTTGEAEVTMAAVQRLIDANPAGFRQLAAAQAEHAADLATAAAARDAATAGELVAGMDGVCEACHANYWYAEQ